MGSATRDPFARSSMIGAMTATIREENSSPRGHWIIAALTAALALIGLFVLRWRARRGESVLREATLEPRPDISELQGLSEAEVEARHLQGRSNVGVSITSPSSGEIWRANLFSILNLNLIGLASLEKFLKRGHLHRDRRFGPKKIVTSQNTTSNVSTNPHVINATVDHRPAVRVDVLPTDVLIMQKLVVESRYGYGPRMSC